VAGVSYSVLGLRLICFRKPTKGRYLSFHHLVHMGCTRLPIRCVYAMVDCVWNVMANAQEQDFVFRRNWRVHLNRLGRQFSRLLAAEVCASSVVMLDTPCSEVAWRVLATHSILQFPLHFSSRASTCAIRFQLDSKTISVQAYTVPEGFRGSDSTF